MSGRSNYPGGFSTGITVRGLPLSVSHPGEIFWVNNSSVLAKGGVSGSNGNPGTYQKPFSTIDYAIGRCTAGRGDIIMVMPGHAETISAAAGITMDVNGVAIIGLGTGLLRPTITFDTVTTAAISWTADYCSIQNFVFIGNFLSVATAILNSGGAGMTVEKCTFKDTSAVLGLLSCITTTVGTNSDDLWFADNERFSDATTTPGTALKIANTTTGLHIVGNEFWHTVAEENIAVVLDHGALVVRRLLMENNKIYSINIAQDTEGFLVKTSASTGSGIIRDNRVRANDPSAAILVTAGAVQYGMFENYFIGDATSVSATLVPTAGGN